MNARVRYTVYSEFYDWLRAAVDLGESALICRTAREVPESARAPAMLAIEHFSRRTPKLPPERFAAALRHGDGG